jgi:hypothetical protein
MIDPEFTFDDYHKILEHAGSWTRFKEMLGLSASELTILVKEHGLSLKALQHYTDPFIDSELRRIKSVALFCIVHRCKESELRRRMMEAGIDPKKYIRPVGHNSGIGRRGELYFKEKRGTSVIEDCLETRGHTAEFDFRDSQYGLVNVKTCTRKKWQAKTRAADPFYWDFNLVGVRSCDFLACVPLGPTGEPLMVLLVKTEGLRGLNHFLVTQKELRSTSPKIMNLYEDVYQWIGKIDNEPEPAEGSEEILQP